MQRRQSKRKQHGVHYTPAELARFLAGHALAPFQPGATPLRVLDPACGDGELLVAIADVAHDRGLKVELTGLDRDPAAIEAASGRLSEGTFSADLRGIDFLSLPVEDKGQQSILDASDPRLAPESFDVVIANPPYVRTQVLGAAVAQELAKRFSLRGRVDLYHAFTLAMSERLRPGGTLALLCSNRFLYTAGGASLRQFFGSEFHIRQIFDLGDTKLFEAAVLPAIVIAEKAPKAPSMADTVFVRIYEAPVPAQQSPTYPGIVAALESERAGEVSVDDKVYSIERGTLNAEQSLEGPWKVSSEAHDAWLHAVASSTWKSFGQVAAIRVGIKTTADKVFVRKDWNALDPAMRPEPELLRPLLTHHVVSRWRSSEPPSSVLYPYRSEDGRRVLIALEDFPRASAYLELHRDTLEARTYVLEAGRKWYEIWVPQNPAELASPKVVFPDISEHPKFALDDSGAIVQGDCYWFPVQADVTTDLAALMLGVANSSFAVAFYDRVSGNRLYSSRRRFITQYVNRFPIPDPDAAGSKRIVAIVRSLIDNPAQAALEQELDEAVVEAFGVK